MAYGRKSRYKQFYNKKYSLCYGESKLTKNYSSSTNYNCKKLLENLQSYQSKYPNSTHPLLAQSYIGNWTSDLGKIARKYILDHLSQEQYK